MKGTDWAKWGSIATAATVAAALIGTWIVHRDQREHVYITVTPVGWKADPFGPELIGTVIYDVTVTGKVPARRVYLRERCVSPVPMNEAVEPQGKQLLGDMVPGTTERRCGMEIKGDPDDVRYVGKFYYEDDYGTQSVQFCFEGDTPNFVAEGKKYADLNPCDFKYDFKDYKD
jgi:hypothetical protein